MVLTYHYTNTISTSDHFVEVQISYLSSELGERKRARRPQGKIPPTRQHGEGARGWGIQQYDKTKDLRAMRRSFLVLDVCEMLGNELCHFKHRNFLLTTENL